MFAQNWERRTIFRCHGMDDILVNVGIRVGNKYDVKDSCWRSEGQQTCLINERMSECFIQNIPNVDMFVAVGNVCMFLLYCHTDAVRLTQTDRINCICLYTLITEWKALFRRVTQTSVSVCSLFIRYIRYVSSALFFNKNKSLCTNVSRVYC